MDEQMIAEITLAIARSEYDGEISPHDAAVAAHSVIAGKVAELEEQRNRLLGAISWIEPPFVDSRTPRDELFRRIQFCVADASRVTDAHPEAPHDFHSGCACHGEEACPAALAPHPERRHE